MSVDKTPELTHLDETGAARMVDVAGKPVTHRRAVAGGFIRMRPQTLAMIVEDRAPKGDVFATARIAGIMAAKRAAELIPMCHPLALTHVSVGLEPEGDGVRITAVAENDGKTGVEIEALTAASVAALALYDMVKAVDRGMVIEEVKLLSKEGGNSGTWTRKENE
ncbi:MAG: cyclic pyranopterin monophosphate synthase MoaC [Coriobacteriia bacterium]|nr:cyclic pyranopterin monophosphate synthase MoaC [Coriobacteriia bacterium]MBN2822004.1 cyclic pyranopterin monophosphate synthase MoaC [Coriobacteriia bacterium]